MLVLVAINGCDVSPDARSVVVVIHLHLCDYSTVCSFVPLHN